jgi:hypothetical protein
VGLGCYYWFENKNRDKLLEKALSAAVDATSVEDEKFWDRTDMEDALKFRHQW